MAGGQGGSGDYADDLNRSPVPSGVGLRHVTAAWSPTSPFKHIREASTEGLSISHAPWHCYQKSEHPLARLAHPSQVGAVGAAVQRGHQDVVVGRCDVWRVRDQRLRFRQRCGAGEEAAVVHLLVSRQRLAVQLAA